MLSRDIGIQFLINLLALFSRQKTFIAYKQRRFEFRPKSFLKFTDKTIVSGCFVTNHVSQSVFNLIFGYFIIF